MRGCYNSDAGTMLVSNPVAALTLCRLRLRHPGVFIIPKERCLCLSEAAKIVPIGKAVPDVRVFRGFSGDLWLFRDFFLWGLRFGDGGSPVAKDLLAEGFEFRVILGAAGFVSPDQI